MTWYATFRSSFFAEWSRRKLAEAPEAATPHAAWPALRCPLLPEPPSSAPANPAAGGRAVDSGIVSSVYGFGVFVGQAYGRLYGLPTSAIRSRADFCGRFNLGISLFDFVCDETRGDDLGALRRLPSLRMFTGTAEARPAVVDPTLRLLDRVAESVLAQLTDELGPARRRSALWRAIFAMFEAQLMRAGADTSRLGDGRDMRAALRLTSAEPFRVMSEWMARGGSTSVATLRRAAAFGLCVGDCYWLIDDAKDVWDDLYAGRWNRFLLDAKAAEPTIPLARPTPILEARLMDVWRRERTAERAARHAVVRLARALEDLGVSQRRARQPMARFHASMRAWYG